uniref:Uncharacterized protein n=1 Tax=Ciona intestinalis TaxID=7719 RepID=H2XN23_CIOIN
MLAYELQHTMYIKTDSYRDLKLGFLLRIELLTCPLLKIFTIYETYDMFTPKNSRSTSMCCIFLTTF